MLGNFIYREKKMYFFLFALIPLFYQVTQYKELFFSEIPFFQYIPLLLIVVISFITGKIAEFKKTKIFILFFLVLFVNYVLIHFVSFNIKTEYIGITIPFLVLNFITYYVIAKISKFTDSKKDKELMLQYFFIGNSIFLVLAVFINFTDLINIDNYTYLFNGSRNSRAWFGFIHPNTAAMYLFVSSMISLYFLEKKKNFYWIMSSIFFLAALLATGSKTGLYGIIILILGYTSYNIFRKIPVKIKIGLSAILIPIVALLVVFQFGELWQNSSGRNDYISSNITQLMESGKLFSGYAPLNYTEIGNYYPVVISDNWYATNLVANGLVGTGVFITFSIYLLIKTKNIFWKMVFLAFLFMSIFENFLFIPGVILTQLIWVCVLSEGENDE